LCGLNNSTGRESRSSKRPARCASEARFCETNHILPRLPIRFALLAASIILRASASHVHRHGGSIKPPASSSFQLALAPSPIPARAPRTTTWKPGSSIPFACEKVFGFAQLESHLRRVSRVYCSLNPTVDLPPVKSVCSCLDGHPASVRHGRAPIMRITRSLLRVVRTSTGQFLRVRLPLRVNRSCPRSHHFHGVEVVRSLFAARPCTDSGVRAPRDDGQYPRGSKYVIGSAAAEPFKSDWELLCS